MVFLTLSRDGFGALRPRIDPDRDAVWVSGGVLSDLEVAELRRPGIDLTVFSHPLDVNKLGPDVATVREHHPKDVVWVEAAPP